MTTQTKAQFAATLFTAEQLAPLRHAEAAMANYASISEYDAALLGAAGIVRVTRHTSGNRAHVKLTDFGREVVAA